MLSTPCFHPSTNLDEFSIKKLRLLSGCIEPHCVGWVPVVVITDNLMCESHTRAWTDSQAQSAGRSKARALLSLTDMAGQCSLPQAQHQAQQGDAISMV